CYYKTIFYRFAINICFILMYLYRSTNILFSFNEIKKESSTLIWTDILRAAALNSLQIREH
ncbi:hypothetical protein, partial [Peribacillus butanolivorans]|uniref:hypothetical protein n=1 Tax=Peribacillus butanolivorans TaxID=421767 RepID=UPI0038191664